LEKENRRLQEENQKLRKELETAQRAARRLAAQVLPWEAQQSPQTPWAVSLVRPMARTTNGPSRII